MHIFVCNSMLRTRRNSWGYFSTKPSGVEVWGLEWFQFLLPQCCKNDIQTLLSQMAALWSDNEPLCPAYTGIACLVCSYKHELRGNRPTHIHIQTLWSSEVQWANSAQLSAAQPSPVLTCRIPVSPPEETLASFTSAWEVSPAVFGSFDTASVTCCLWYKRVTQPYRITGKFNHSFWNHLITLTETTIIRSMGQTLFPACSCCPPINVM